MSPPVDFAGWIPKQLSRIRRTRAIDVSRQACAAGSSSHKHPGTPSRTSDGIFISDATCDPAPIRRTETPNIIDVEASGFGARSCPIEVGVALEDGAKYCSLILPAPQWEHWDPEAERVRRIGRDVLAAYGRPPAEVALALNERFSGRTLFSDAWVVDKPCLTTLFDAARMPMTFSVSPLELILTEAQMERWHEAKARVLVEVNQQRYRASIDAWVIQQTYVRTFRESGAVPA